MLASCLHLAIFSYLYPDGKPDNGQSESLSRFLSTFAETRIHVDSEQQRLYSAIGTTYELCKICDERDKNVRLEPCDHLLCSVCLKSWQESSNEHSTSCPFCRETIRGTQSVIISVDRRVSTIKLFIVTTISVSGCERWQPSNTAGAKPASS